MVGDPIVLVNRTSKPLTFQVDGRQFTLQPGKNYNFLEGHARFAMAQNPLNGTEDYYTLQFVSLVGVEGKTDCESIPDEVIEAAKEAERFDISSLDPRRQARQAVFQRALRGRQAGSLVGQGGALSTDGH